MNFKVPQVSVSLDQGTSGFTFCTSKMGFWDWDILTGEMCISNHFCRILGYDPDEMRSLNLDSWKERIHPEDLTKLEIAIDFHLKGAKSAFEIEVRFLDKSGEWKWILVRGKVIAWDENHNPSRMIGVHFDTTKLKENEETLRFNDDLLEAIKTFQLDYFEIDDYDKILYQLLATVVRLTNSEYGFIGEVVEDEDNKVYLKFCAGKNLEDISKLDPLQKTSFLNEIESHSFHEMLQKIVDTQEVIIVEGNSLEEAYLKSFMGLPVCVNGELIAILGVVNRPGSYCREILDYLNPLMVTVGNLIQTRKHTHLRIETEQILKLFIKHNPAAVAMFDQNLCYLLASDAWLKDYNPRGIDIIGKSLYETFPIVPSRWKQFKESCLQGKVEISEEEELLMPNGITTWIKWEAHPWYKSDKTVGGVILFTEMITEYKNARLKMQKMIDDLTRSNRELETFAYVCSHDLKEPLRTISSFIHLIHRHNAGTFDSTTQEYFGFVQKGVERMRHLIEDILVYSKVDPENVHHTIISIESIISEIKETLSTRLKESKTTIEANYFPEIYGDYTQITQLFRNLIENSIKFRSFSPPIIKIEATSKGGYWHFTVRDNGIGIPQEYQEKVFLMFERLHGREKYEGSGIGLALCKKIVEYHGGEIGVSSNEFGGCDFYFTLPTGLIKHKLIA